VDTVNATKGVSEGADRIVRIGARRIPHG